MSRVYVEHVRDHGHPYWAAEVEKAIAGGGRYSERVLRKLNLRSRAAVAIARSNPSPNTLSPVGSHTVARVESEPMASGGRLSRAQRPSDTCCLRIASAEVSSGEKQTEPKHVEDGYRQELDGRDRYTDEATWPGGRISGAVHADNHEQDGLQGKGPHHPSSGSLERVRHNPRAASCGSRAGWQGPAPRRSCSPPRPTCTNPWPRRRGPHNPARNCLRAGCARFSSPTAWPAIANATRATGLRSTAGKPF